MQYLRQAENEVSVAMDTGWGNCLQVILVFRCSYTNTYEPLHMLAHA